MFVPSDLHGHTLFSDGRATPEQYVEFRRELGIRAVAIADHDVLRAVPRGAAAAAAAGMVFVPAVEVTSFIHFGTPDAEQIHILAYYPDALLRGPRLAATALHRRGLRVEARWRDFVLGWVSSLEEADRAALSTEGPLEALPPGEFPALQSFIDRIVRLRRPLFEAFREHHVRFWEEDRELFGWEPEEAIDAIRADGALDIVAHPARYRDKERLQKILLRASGLEVYTSRHKPEVAASFRAFAEEHRKHWTASSDDHQNARYMRPPSGTPLPTLERILRRPLSLDLVLTA
ncbi:MAG TPA: PHP domain-containing protein [Polyangiaceae bacterium]|jgi:predicted metal-dependent phosphoesterase TrpH|nr:PHP domain-containing protein [Polyangiaceae bacterium]